MKKQKRMSRFQCSGKSVKIIYTKKLLQGNPNILGLCVPLQNQLYVKITDPLGYPMPEDTINQILWHEISHYIMGCMNEGDLYQDEKFIDYMGALLHEIDKTKK